jgi:putative lipoic acid-binding regulatory protein
MAVTIKINPCPSGTVDVEKSDGNLIAAVNVAAGAVAAYQVADSTVNVQKSNGGAIASVSVKATETDAYQVADSTVNVQKSNGGAIASVSVKATETDAYQVADSTVNVQKSNGGAIASVSVKATETDAYQVADSPVTVNAAAFANVKATESQEVPVQYPDNTATGTISSGVVRINNNRFNIASAWKTGQTTSYAANDDGARQQGAGAAFGTLSENNPFGNTNRFTDTLGGQTYANDIVVDWAGADYVGKTVPMWYRVVLGGGGGVNWATAIGGQPFTFSGYNDWYIPNVGQGAEICNYGLAVATNYAPFNISVLAGTAAWTSTVNQANTTTAKIIGYGGIANFARTSSANYILYRTATFAELGITNY